MAMYRKKPAVVEAWQFTPSPIMDWPEWLQRAIRQGNVTTGDGLYIIVRTIEGTMTAQSGDWIIQGVKGELYPCKPDIFAATYEPAETERLPDVDTSDTPETIHEDDYHHPNQRATRFRDEMQQVINSHSREDGSDTPDFILAEFMLEAFDAFDKAVTKRSNWYGGDSKSDLQAQLQAEGEHTAAGQAEIERLQQTIKNLEAKISMQRTELQRASTPSRVIDQAEIERLNDAASANLEAHTRS